MESIQIANIEPDSLLEDFEMPSELRAPIQPVTMQFHNDNFVVIKPSFSYDSVNKTAFVSFNQSEEVARVCS